MGTGLEIPFWPVAGGLILIVGRLNARQYFPRYRIQDRQRREVDEDTPGPVDAPGCQSPAVNISVIQAYGNDDTQGIDQDRHKERPGQGSGQPAQLAAAARHSGNTGKRGHAKGDNQEIHTRA